MGSSTQRFHRSSSFFLVTLLTFLRTLPPCPFFYGRASHTSRIHPHENSLTLLTLKLRPQPLFMITSFLNSPCRVVSSQTAPTSHTLSLTSTQPQATMKKYGLRAWGNSLGARPHLVLTHLIYFFSARPLLSFRCMAGSEQTPFLPSDSLPLVAFIISVAVTQRPQSQQPTRAALQKL